MYNIVTMKYKKIYIKYYIYFYLGYIQNTKNRKVYTYNILTHIPTPETIIIALT